MKKYAIVIDTSPSEQISDDDDQIFCLGILLGLRSPESFDLVGKDFPEEDKRLDLRKYSGSSNHYKTKLIKHLEYIKNAEHILTGVSVINQRFIKCKGLKIWKVTHGPLPTPFDFSKKGKPRYQLGGYKINGDTEIKPYLVLEDDLCIIGWLAYELGLLHEWVCHINNKFIKLDVLIDRLPNDQGITGTNKAVLLKGTIDKLTNSLIKIVGISDKADHYQRDLLVDNIAGLSCELIKKNQTTGRDEIENLFDMTKFNLP